MHGKGQCRWNNGHFYKGEYMMGRKHGCGEFYWPDGRKLEGLWNQDKIVSGLLKDAHGTIQ